MEPEKDGFQKECPFPEVYFQGQNVNFRGSSKFPKDEQGFLNQKMQIWQMKQQCWVPQGGFWQSWMGAKWDEQSQDCYSK